ncbi:hypothetical protein ACVWU4_000974 [Campylobacter coli]
MTNLTFSNSNKTSMTTLSNNKNASTDIDIELPNKTGTLITEADVDSKILNLEDKLTNIEDILDVTSLQESGVVRYFQGEMILRAGKNQTVKTLNEAINICTKLKPVSRTDGNHSIIHLVLDSEIDLTASIVICSLDLRYVYVSSVTHTATTGTTVINIPKTINSWCFNIYGSAYSFLLYRGQFIFKTASNATVGGFITCCESSGCIFSASMCVDLSISGTEFIKCYYNSYVTINLLKIRTHNNIIRFTAKGTNATTFKTLYMLNVYHSSYLNMYIDNFTIQTNDWVYLVLFYAYNFGRIYINGNSNNYGITITNPNNRLVSTEGVNVVRPGSFISVLNLKIKIETNITAQHPDSVIFIHIHNGGKAYLENVFLENYNAVNPNDGELIRFCNKGCTFMATRFTVTNCNLTHTNRIPANTFNVNTGNFLDIKNVIRN